MRLIFTLLCLTSLLSCHQNGNEKVKIEVILAYLDSNINQKIADLRIYNPPPPPELKGYGKNNKGNVKPDSIIDSLKPLQIYIGDSVYFTPNFKIQKEPIKNFSFLKEISISKSQPVYLNINSLKRKNGIILRSINREGFREIYPDIYLNDNYGGLFRFQNLFVSKNGKKAYFEVFYFRRNLNASNYIVYAEFLNGEWGFKSEMISVS